jgi:uroporphyrinogen-III decarboxylase
MFEPLIQAGKKIIYTSDGNYTKFIDDIAECKVSGFVMEPTTDMAYIAEKYGKTHSFIGNADTRILLSGTKEEIYGEVKRCMDIGKKHPGFIMAVGNHIPANTPIENALYYNEVYEKLSKR